ncbi:hypothetical protein KI387_041468, partial [Taxus chinensis]
KNDGPSRETAKKEVDWNFIIGGGTIDRDYTAILKLGNDSIVVGSYIPSFT